MQGFRRRPASDADPAVAALRLRRRAFIVHRRLTQRRRHVLWAYVFMLPSLALFALVVAFPTVDAFVVSFYQWRAFAPRRFVGLENYARMIQDPLFWQSLKVTLIWAAGVVPSVLVLGLAVAVALDQRWLKARGVFRTIYFAPVMTSMVAAAFTWRWMFDPGAGMVNYLLRVAGVADPPGWLASPVWALPALMIVAVWQQIGYAMVLFLAGLQTIPREVREAAAIDGARGWQVFWRVTLPLLNPTVVLVTVILGINAFRVFTIPYVMTSGGLTMLTPGGPLNSTRVFVFNIYDIAWRRFDMGYGAANAVALLLIVLVATLVQMKLVQRQFEY